MIEPARPLNETERAVLDRILGEPWRGVDAARAQLASALYVEGSAHVNDQCFDIRVADGSSPRIDAPDGPWAGLAVVLDNQDAGVLDIWIEDGRLASLEYSWFGDDVPRRLPKPEELEPIRG